MPTPRTPLPPQSEEELLQNAQRIAGASLLQLATQAGVPIPESLHKSKGFVGTLLEQLLGATAASLPEPDFQHIGVELKTVPVNRQGLPQESTYVCTVPLMDNTGQSWETSWIRRKLQRVLWVPVEAEKDIPLTERRVGMALLWSPDVEQERILRQDWEELTDLIVTGQLEQISARQGTWLQVRPKAANARALCTTYDAEGRPSETLPRGFYLRPAFTRQILSRHFVNV